MKTRTTIQTRTTLGALVLLAGIAQAQSEMIGVAFRDPSFVGNTTLYDIDASTGLATVGRTLGTDAISGIALASNGTLYGLTDEFAQVNGTPVDGALVTIDRATGATTFVGNVSPFASSAFALEGDIDFDPSTGTLYGVTSNGGTSLLFTIDTATGANTEIDIIQQTNTDMSAMAFDAFGNLWLLNTTFDFDPATRFTELLRVDAATGDIIDSVVLDTTLGTVAGMDFDPISGQLYIADGDFLGTNNLYTANVFTGELSLVGPTGLNGDPTGFGGLADIEFIPAPGTAAVLAFAGLLASRSRAHRNTNA